MERLKLPEQLIPSEQSKPSEPGSTLLFWAESSTSIFFMAVLYTVLNAQMAVAEIENKVLTFTPSAYKGGLEIKLPKSCPNDLVTNQGLKILLFKAGLPANAKFISITGRRVRYYTDNCEETFTVDIQHTRSGHLALAMKAPTLPTKIKPKN